MFSCGMFSALAARIAVRSRGFPSGSPPPLAAIEISLIMRVNILPRLASSAPFLCLIVAHLEWPDMGTSTVVKNGGAGTHPTSDYTIFDGQAEVWKAGRSECRRFITAYLPGPQKHGCQVPGHSLRFVSGHPLHLLPSGEAEAGSA